MVNRLCASERPCADAIATDPSVEPAQRRCCFRRLFISVLLLGNFECAHARLCRASGPAAPLSRPLRSAPPRRFHLSARTAGVSGSHRKGDGEVVVCGKDFWKDFMRLQ